MNLILSTILQEKERIDRMLSKYQEELGTLPKGTISEKKVKQSTYFYLKYREGKKVISRYILDLVFIPQPIRFRQSALPIR